MRRLIGFTIVIICAAVSVSAQTGSQKGQQARKHHGEGKNAILRVDKVTAPETEASFTPHTAYNYSLDEFKPGVVRVGPRTTYLKAGLKTEEVIRFMGKPLAVSERIEKNITVTVYEFQRGDGQLVIAEFENGLLARSRTEVRANVVDADR